MPSHTDLELAVAKAASFAEGLRWAASWLERWPNATAADIHRHADIFDGLAKAFYAPLQVATKQEPQP